MEGDFVDKINDFWSVLLLAVCAVGSLLVRFLPSMSSQCLTPERFSGSMAKYVDSSQFLSETYYEPFHNDTNIMYTSYHLWIPIILFFQALVFKIPDTLMHFLNGFLIPGVRVHSMLQSGQTNPKDDRDLMTAGVSRMTTEILDNNRMLQTFMYFSKKFLSCLITVGQLIFIEVYFKSGRSVLPEMNTNTRPSFLPRGLVAYDYSIRNLGNVMMYTVQCIIPVNEIYDKLFVFVWYWLLLVVSVSVINLFFWAMYIFVSMLSRQKIEMYLTSASLDSPNCDVDRFVSYFLGWDGVCLIHQLSLSGLEVQAAGLTQHLWEIFHKRTEPRVYQAEDTLHITETST